MQLCILVSQFFKEQVSPLKEGIRKSGLVGKVLVSSSQVQNLVKVMHFFGPEVDTYQLSTLLVLSRSFYI